MQTDQIVDRDLHSAAPGMSAESSRNFTEARTIVCQAVPILGSEYSKIVIAFLRQAKRKIDVAAYCWKWYEHMATTDMQRLSYALIEKARHGVPIRVRFNHETKDAPLSKENAKTAQRLRRYNVQTKFDGTKIMSHLKMIIIDDEVAIIGSHNLTTRSVSQNNETSVALIGREIVVPYRDYFEALWNNK